MKARQLTLRNLSPQMAARLKALSAARGESLNSTLLFILHDALGISERCERLKRYTTWNTQDREEFDKTLALQRTIDEELWR